MMTRDRDAAEQYAAKIRANVGKTSSWGRITETTMGVEFTEREHNGRPLYIVNPIIHNHDPLVDGNLSREVWAARQAFVGQALRREMLAALGTAENANESLTLADLISLDAAHVASAAAKAIVNELVAEGLVVRRGSRYFLAPLV